MSRTRFIYFLSAIVLIIGCFALNTSYSLFVDNDSTQLVETTVPTITDEVTLSLPSVDVEGTKEYLIKQTITNNNSIPIGFRLTVSSDSTTYQVQSTTYEDDTYLSYGTVEANTSKDIYLRVANTNADINNIATINFALQSDYATLKMNTDEYLSSANIDNETQYEIEIPALPYSDNQETLTYKLIKRETDKNGASNSSGVDSLFSETINQIALPLESSFSVPVLTNAKDLDNVESGMYQTADDLGISHYYRGTISDNFLSFNNMCWRIVRIEGDGSIKLLLADSSVPCDDENYKTSNNNSAFIGKTPYGYINESVDSIRSYNRSDYLNSDNGMKKAFEEWFGTKFTTDNIISKIKKDKWFIDDESQNFSLSGQPLTILPSVGNGYMNYLAKRIEIDNLISLSYTENYIKDESYIGTLTIDEIYLAGAYNGYLLTNAVAEESYSGWFSLSIKSKQECVPGVACRNGLPYSERIYVLAETSINGNNSSTEHQIRPAITLLNSVEVTGEGTQDNPYTVKLNKEA